MTIRDIIGPANPVLRHKARPVSEARDPALQKLIDDMIETMRQAPGVGLAAPQVHEELRVFVAQVMRDREDDHEEEGDEAGRPEILALINPEITPASRHVEEDWEGCLSIPDLRGLVPRYRDIAVKGFDREGKPIELQASGFMARVIQHETDHLDGTVFVDHLSSLKRELIRRRMKKLKAEHASSKPEDVKNAPEHRSAL